MWVQGRYSHTACHVVHCHRNLKNTHMDGHSHGVEPCAGHHTAGGLMGVAMTPVANIKKALLAGALSGALDITPQQKDLQVLHFVDLVSPGVDDGGVGKKKGRGGTCSSSPLSPNLCHCLASNGECTFLLSGACRTKEYREDPQHLADLKIGLCFLAKQAYDCRSAYDPGRAVNLRAAARESVKVSKRKVDMFNLVRTYWQGEVDKATMKVIKPGIVHSVGSGAEDYEGTYTARLKSIEDLEWNVIGNPIILDQSFFTKTDFDAVAESVRIFGEWGFPMDENVWRGTMQRIATKKLEEEVVRNLRPWVIYKTEGNGGDIPECGPTMFKK